MDNVSLTALAREHLDEHENPGEATVQVLHRRVRLVAESSWRGAVGHLISVPETRHSLEAEDDAAV